MLACSFTLRPASLAGLAFSLLATTQSWGVTVATSAGDHSSDPGTGAPWDNVLNVVGTQGSAVYLGGGWVLTANHVFDDNPSATSSSVSYSGDEYQADPSYIFELDNPFTITSTGGTANPDLRLYRLEYDLGLPSIDIGNATVGEDVTMIGFGGGKSWGNNEITATGINLAVNGRDTALFFTTYDSEIAGEAQGRIGDSGGATYFEVTVGPNQGWYLGGIMVAVGNVGDIPGTFHADLSAYESQISSIIATNGNAPAIPEPSIAVLTGIFALSAGSRRRR
ncbi:MAG: serine protease [Verrucomicrobiota bacterium JB023]|nr:serine protease [Verrucomicrobiota bacterium JB023]